MLRGGETGRERGGKNYDDDDGGGGGGGAGDGDKESNIISTVHILIYIHTTYLHLQ